MNDAYSVRSVEILAGGVFQTPWGSGKWGVTTRPRTLYASFIGADHLLAFSDDSATSFSSTRCSDGEVVKGIAVAAAAG